MNFGNFFVIMMLSLAITLFATASLESHEQELHRDTLLPKDAVMNMTKMIYGSRLQYSTMNEPIYAITGQMHIFVCPDTNNTEEVVWTIEGKDFDTTIPDPRRFSAGQTFAILPVQLSDAGLVECYVDGKLRGSNVLEVEAKTTIIFIGVVVYLMCCCIVSTLHFVFGIFITCRPSKRAFLQPMCPSVTTEGSDDEFYGLDNTDTDITDKSESQTHTSS